MSPAEWIITVVVVLALVVGSIAILRLRRSVGTTLPGRMCAGCPNACGVRGKPPACMEKPKEAE